MNAIVAFLISPRFLLTALSIVSVIGYLAYVRHSGYKECLAELKEANATQKEKFHEIAAHRPDTDALVRSLLAGSF